MQDDQWPYPPNRGGQRERADGSMTSSPLQRSGRPPNGASPSYNGRPSGQTSASGNSQPRIPAAGNQRPPGARPGPSGPLARSPAARDDGWGPSSTSTYQQRRPSGPMNPAAPAGGQTRGTNPFYNPSAGNPPGRRPSGPTGSAGQRPAGRGSSWEDEEQRWLGPENARPSRGLSSPLDVPGGGRQGGRGPATQRTSGGIQRGWAEQDDSEEEGWTPSGRPLASSGARRASGSVASGRSGKSKAAGRTIRDGWVVETPPRKPANPLRTRLLLTLLLVIVLLGGAIVAVPSVRQKVLAHIPGLGGSSSSGQTTGTTGTLSLQVNVPTAKVTVDNQTVTVQPGQNGGFATATLDGLALGSHTLSIHADNFADFSQTVSIKAGTNSWVAWLAPSADALTAAMKQFGPAVQPDPGVAGDHYLAANKVATAGGAMTVSISYTIAGLDPKAFTSQIAQGSDTTTSPFQPATVTLVPVVTFKDANGNTLGTYSPAALPAAQLALQVVPGTDDKGAVQLSATGITLKTSGGQAVTTDFSGPAKTDWALYYAIAAILPASPANALTFKCVGAVDNKNYNPEDGLLIVETADDTAHAHYFYRWGMLWATNGPAQTLTPQAPRAPAGSNEFDSANTARANGSCGG